jgi:hypothetical protein
MVTKEVFDFDKKVSIWRLTYIIWGQAIKWILCLMKIKIPLSGHQMDFQLAHGVEQKPVGRNKWK